MGYFYYSNKKFDRDKFQASIEGCLEMGRLRLNPSLRDVDSLIFLHRRPIIAQWLAELPKDLLLLDIGGRIQPYRPLIENQVRRYIGLDLQREGLVNVICTAEHLPFGDGCCDVLLCTDTLQYIPDAGAAIKEMHRVLRPGGKLILSTRGCYPEHHDEHWRFMPDGLRYLSRMFSSVDIVPEGYSGSGLMIAINVLLHRNIQSDRIKRITTRTTIPLLNRMGLFLDRLIGKDSRTACGVSMLAIK